MQAQQQVDQAWIFMGRPGEVACPCHLVALQWGLGCPGKVACLVTSAGPRSRRPWTYTELLGAPDAHGISWFWSEHRAEQLLWLLSSPPWCTSMALSGDFSSQLYRNLQALGSSHLASFWTFLVRFQRFSWVTSLVVLAREGFYWIFLKQQLRTCFWKETKH